MIQDGRGVTRFIPFADTCSITFRQLVEEKREDTMKVNGLLSFANLLFVTSHCFWTVYVSKTQVRNVQGDVSERSKEID